MAIRIPYHEMEFSYARSRGPGGQNVNKTNSAVILKWHLESSDVLTEETKQRLLIKLAGKITKEGHILIRSEVHRDQDQNKSDCIAKLHSLLEKALFVPRKRVATKPSRSSVRKRLDTKTKHSEIKSLRKKVT
ncbi:Peptidyl-tRNA hydrolase ArfB [compost metagenome]